jgi:hypothetical protein
MQESNAWCVIYVAQSYINRRNSSIVNEKMSDMSSNNTMTEETEEPTQQTVLLNIPPRLQWNNGNGYCGEAAVQSMGMFIEYITDRRRILLETQNDVV